MGDVTTELVLGAQTRARAEIAGDVPTVERQLKDAAVAVQAEAPGFTGSAAAHFYDALGAWLKAAATIPVALAAYAVKLGQTDAAVAASQAGSAAAYRRAETRLGPP